MAGGLRVVWLAVVLGARIRVASSFKGCEFGIWALGRSASGDCALQVRRVPSSVGRGSEGHWLKTKHEQAWSTPGMHRGFRLGMNQ